MPENAVWRSFVHPLFVEQHGLLRDSVDRARRANPATWQRKPDARLYAMIRALTRDRIPRDPLAPEFRQGNTLGPAHRHWFRAKFAGNRFRLFFRADSTARIIVYAWVNDRDRLRKAGADSDPYALFGRMLAGGSPPDEWEALLASAQEWHE